MLRLSWVQDCIVYDNPGDPYQVHPDNVLHPILVLCLASLHMGFLISRSPTMQNIKQVAGGPSNLQTIVKIDLLGPGPQAETKQNTKIPLDLPSSTNTTENFVTLSRATFQILT